MSWIYRHGTAMSASEYDHRNKVRDYAKTDEQPNK